MLLGARREGLDWAACCAWLAVGVLLRARDKIGRKKYHTFLAIFVKRKSFHLSRLRVDYCGHAYARYTRRAILASLGSTRPPARC